jgi:NitT/TauT family transport system ATP-binding protein
LTTNGSGPVSQITRGPDQALAGGGTHSGLSIRNVMIEYQTARSGKKRALQDINLTIDNGAFVCIVGTSGCGKTTLLKAIDGLVPINSGSVELNGKKITGPGTDRGVVFQAPSLLPWRSVEANIRYGLEMQGRAKAADTDATVTDLIRLVGLQGFEHSYPSELSGGMQQRVNLARALAVDPELLLLDEPFAALDAQTRELMQSELLNIWERTSKTAMFITHQIDEAVYLADQVVVMTARPGRIREIIPIDLPRPRSLSIKRDPAFVAYLDQVWTLIEQEGRASGSTAPPA